MRDTYILSSNIDSNKVFIVNRSEIEGRLDPLMALYDRKIRSFKYDITPLKNLLLRQPQYGANESGIERLDDKSIRYIRITDINEYGLLKTDSLGATAANIEEKYILSDGDILFARSGATVGKAYLHSRKNVAAECVFAGYMIRFIVDKSRLLPEYLFVYTQLSPYKEWVNAIQRAAGQPNINAEEYKSLQLPLPSLTEQYNIVKIIQQAYCQKQQKEAEAKALLDGIDDYLLKILGIVKPAQNNQLTNRIFTVSFSNLSGNKYSPTIYYNKSMKVYGGIYVNFKLQNIASISKGQSITKEKISNGAYPVIAGGQTSPYNHSEFNNKGNCITISASGAYAGYVWCHKDAIFASDCSVVRTYDEQAVKTDFLFEILKLKQSEIYLLQQGAGQPHVYPYDIAKLQIPVPPIKKQEEIAMHISEIRTKAQALQQEAQSILDTAKKEVEQMILGE